MKAVPGDAGKEVARARLFAHMLRVYAGESPECDAGYRGVPGRLGGEWAGRCDSAWDAIHSRLAVQAEE